MSKKILLIEDSKTDAQIVKDLLKAEGLVAEVATTGKEGLLQARAMMPDLIILDLILPDISGFEVCAKIKKDAILKNTIVVVLSIKSDVEIISEAFRQGADDYVVKPPYPEFLIKKIKLYLGLRS